MIPPEFLIFSECQACALADRRSFRKRHACPRTGRFAADVKQVRTFVQQTQSVLQRFFRGEELAAVRKRVGSNVEDSHNEGPLSQFQSS